MAVTFKLLLKQIVIVSKISFLDN